MPGVCKDKTFDEKRDVQRSAGTWCAVEGRGGRAAKHGHPIYELSEMLVNETGQVREQSVRRLLGILPAFFIFMHDLACMCSWVSGLPRYVRAIIDKFH